MANSPRDGRSGSGPLDTDQAERLAELFQPSWEVGSGPSAAARPARSEMEKFGTTTAPEVPVPTHKKTLVGLPVPTPVMPAAKAASVPAPSATAMAAAAEAAARAASKKTLMGVAPPAVGRSTSRSSQPPPVKVPSHAPPPPPPPDLAETKPWSKGATSTPPRTEPAAKSSPRSSRPSGVAKAYVPKEDPHTPAVVVNPDALRDGEAAAAAEEARRRARAEAARHAKTMRARPGELGFERELKKSRKGWVIAAGLVGALGVGGFFALRSADDPGPIAEDAALGAKPETATAPPPPQIPVVPSPEALPVESPPEPTVAPEPVAAEALRASPAREPARAEARAAKPQPAARQNATPKRAEAKPAQPEPKKTAEPQKKNVIVRDAPF